MNDENILRCVDPYFKELYLGYGILSKSSIELGRPRTSSRACREQLTCCNFIIPVLFVLFDPLYFA